MHETKVAYECGTPIYMSPEMAKKSDYLGGPADIWALGVILFILLTGKMPFHGAYEEDLIRKIQQGKYNFPNNLTNEKGRLTDLSPGAKDYIKRFFQMDQARRPTAEALLKDPWIRVQGQ